MVDASLDDRIAQERSLAVRVLLAGPMLDVESDRDAFRSVIRHADWLVEYFEQTCGWTLTIDPAAGFARLAKRPVVVDITRPLRRSRGEGAPFDRRRYQLLCQVCAELVRHPVTTVGLLASALTAEAGLDTSRYGERTAFVDALRILMSWGAVRVTAGEVDAFVDSEHANAILSADTARLHRLIVTDMPPSALPRDLDVDRATDRLTDEPRYGERDLTDEARNRRIRHRLGRRMLDDPAVYVTDLADGERDYLASISGRRWLRDRAAAAGLELEERREGVVAVDPDAIATDLRFPAPQGNAYQLALLLADRLLPLDGAARRTLCRLESHELRRVVADVLARFPRWARGRREGEGPEQLAAEAVELLVRFGLVRRDDDGSIAALPALARYRVGEPVVRDEASLFEEEA